MDKQSSCFVTIPILALLLAPTQASCQSPVRVEGPSVVLAASDSQRWIKPVWSPDESANRLAFTSENYRGIWVKDLDSGEERLVTDEVDSGFGFDWSPDGTAIATRVARFGQRRRSDAIMVYDLTNRTQHLVSEFSNRIRSVPRWTAEGSAILVAVNGALHRVPSPVEPLRKTDTTPTNTIVIDNGRLLRVSESGSTTRINAPGDGTVLNLAQSRDGLRIAFEILGGDLHVSNADGSGIVSLGRGSRPSWSPDGRWIVFQRSDDDGHRLVTSDLMIGSKEGRVWGLTDTRDVLESNPSWSPDGETVAYDSDGQIYGLKLRVIQ